MGWVKVSAHAKNTHVLKINAKSKQPLLFSSFNLKVLSQMDF